MIDATRRELGVGLALLACLLGLGWQVHSGGLVVRIDEHVRAAVLHAQVPVVREVAVGVTLLGTALVLVPLFLALAAAVSWGRGSVEPLVSAALASGLLAVSVVALKALLARPATDGISVPALGGAWPSGHTTTATVVFLLLADWVRDRRGPAPRYQAALVRCIPAAVAAALVYADYHWLSDVVAGLLLGTLIVLTTRALVGQLLLRRPPRGGGAPPARPTAAQKRA